MFKRIDHIEVVPSNSEKTIAFYIDVLGFKIKNRIKINMPPMREVIYLQLGDTVIEVIAVDNPAPASNKDWEVGYKAMAFEVENMEKAVAFLKAKGVVISRAPVDLGDSFRGEILDPDGLTIELRQWKKPV